VSQQATIARSAPIWFECSTVIVALGVTYLFQSVLSLLCSIIIQGCTEVFM